VPEKHSWKGLANTFSDLQFEIEQTAIRLLGSKTVLAIDPKLLRQFEQLTGGERQMLLQA
jgi:chitinase